MESEFDRQLIDELQTRLGYLFGEPERLARSLTHRSFANERSGGGSTVDLDNERFEFLGDAVLDLALSELLMQAFPADAEGALSKKRASLVNEERLAAMAIELKLDGLIRLGRGESKTGGLQKPRILASTLEAILGAIFIDGGFEPSKNVIARLFEAGIDEVGKSDVDFRGDFKSRLQERTQELYRSTPVYKVEREFGPDHDKVFEVSVYLAERMLAIGRGRSKKAAEQDAARQALESLG